MLARQGELNLLPVTALIRTSEVDHADWNYRPLLGYVQRTRFRLIRSLLGTQQYARLLEIGYGSGVFMPELKARCHELYGIDPHPKNAEVQAVLARHGVPAQLHCGSAEELPFEDRFLDCIVSVSALEYVPDIEVACSEFRRVLKPGGSLVVVTPGFSPLLDLALRVTTGEHADQYQGRRQRLLPALTARFEMVREKPFPPFISRLIKLYTCVRLEAR